MIPATQLRWVAPDAEVTEVLAVMDDGDVGQVPVVRDGQLRGLVGHDHLLRVIRMEDRSEAWFLLKLKTR